MTKYLVAFLALLAFSYALARFGRSAVARRAGRIVMRVMSYILAALSALMVWLGFFSQQEGTFTMLLLALPLALGAGAAFKLSSYCALYEAEWYPK
jgi:hypothetical protein